MSSIAVAPSQSLSRRITDQYGGNYILTVGMPASGKTTFQCFLIHYLDGPGRQHFHLEALPIVGKKDDSKVMLAVLRETIGKGDFMPSTKRGSPKEYAYRLTPTGRTPYKDILEIGLFEASGEDLKAGLIFQQGQKQALYTEFKQLLASPHVKLSIVLMCDGAKLDQNDRFFADFLDYIKNNTDEETFDKLRAKSRMMIIISKPDEAERQLFEEGGIKNQPVAQQIIEKYLPETLSNILVNWRHAPLGYRLSLGVVGTAENDQGVEIKKLQAPDYTHIATIFEDIYDHSTGKRRSRLAKLLWG